MASKVSFHVGKKWNRKHNTREFNQEVWNRDGHIDYSRTEQNQIYTDFLKWGDWKTLCESIFGRAIDAYNAAPSQKKNKERQKNKDTFYKELQSHVEECVIQVGNEDENPLTEEQHGQFFKEVLEHWKAHNPSLHIVGAYAHFDETTPHLHIDYLPIAHRTNGLTVYSSVDGALAEMGYKRGKSRSENRKSQWQREERKAIEDIARGFSVEVEEADHSGGKKHQEYNVFHAREEAKNAAILNAQASASMDAAEYLAKNVDQFDRGLDNIQKVFEEECNRFKKVNKKEFREQYEQRAKEFFSETLPGLKGVLGRFNDWFRSMRESFNSFLNCLREEYIQRNQDLEREYQEKERSLSRRIARIIKREKTVDEEVESRVAKELEERGRALNEDRTRLNQRLQLLEQREAEYRRREDQRRRMAADPAWELYQDAQRTQEGKNHERV